MAATNEGDQPGADSRVEAVSRTVIAPFVATVLGSAVGAQWAITGNLHFNDGPPGMVIAR